MTDKAHSGPSTPARVSIDEPADWLALAADQSHHGNHDAALRALRSLAIYDNSFRRWLAAARLRHRILDAGPERTTYRLGVVGTSTLSQLGPALEVAGLVSGLDLEVRVAGYGQFETEILDPTSDMHAFDPHALLLAPDISACRFPSIDDDPAAFVASEADRWTDPWRSFEATGSPRLLQYNFVAPFERPLGGLDARHQYGRRRFVRRLNDEINQRAGTTVHLVDVASLAEDVGLVHWFDDRYWFQAKQPFSLACLPNLARTTIATLGAGLARSRKVVVTDLDDTLWAGTVGEDGVENLGLSGNPRGEAHLALQDYLLQLKARGIIIAVCSKNDEHTARRVFEERDDMRMQLADIAVFVANWGRKSDNLHLIADRLDLPLDSFVFLDDNPAERQEVRLACPTVEVLELPDEPSGFRRTLATYTGFEPLQMTAEDSQRTEQYRARASALELRDRSDTLAEYLGSLEMQATLREFDELTLQRVAQLVAKTNQFNLTSRRHTSETLRAFAADPMAITVSLHLRDRFGDHGIVAVAIASLVTSNRADIDTLLMSCRVIGRGVEGCLLSALAERAQEKGASILHGTYFPSGKNTLVADLFEALGFTPGPKDSWSLSIDEACQLSPTSIKYEWS